MNQTTPALSQLVPLRASNRIGWMHAIVFYANGGGCSCVNPTELGGFTQPPDARLALTK